MDTDFLFDKAETKSANTEVLQERSESVSKLNYSVIIEKVKEGFYSAIVWGLPDCKASGATREEALTNVRQLLTARLEKAEIVSLEMEVPKPEHSWMKFAGMYKDNPLFNEMLSEMEAYRRELDAEMEEYDRKMDVEGKNK